MTATMLPMPTVLGPLTAREAQVLVMVADGLTSRAIGSALYVTEDTVKTHLRLLYRKLGARNRGHAVARGYQLGILRLPPAEAGAR